MNQGPHRLDPQEREALERLVDLALEEDHAREDVTSALCVPADARGRFEVRNRAPGVPAGLEAVALTLERLGADVSVETRVEDGTPCERPTVLAVLDGRRRDVLAAERTFLNLLGVLGGTATLTRRFVDAAGPHCRILDTRKTWPGYRLLQKYAVRCGGGMNHRPHLAGGVLLKDNHRHTALDLEALVARARQEHPGLPVVVEVDDLEQLERALTLAPDRVLLDNFPADRVALARERRDAAAPAVGLEVSGGVDLDSVGPLAAAGADFASVGALTHSAPVWDVGLDEVGGTPR